MNSLSTSAFSPVAFSLGLLLVMATAFPTPVPLGEDFKDGTTSNRPFTSPDKSEELIKYILGRISAMRKEETCLMRITIGLLEFQIYLDYLQNYYEGDKGNTEAVQISTKALIQLLRQKVKQPEEVSTPNPITGSSLLNKLQTENQWMKNTKMILILRSLEDFLQFSLRAVRIM
ncbi:interleukin-6 precursor [Camelus ferus]|nr:interleukin-6 precursor [Camelus ferus]